MAGPRRRRPTRNANAPNIAAARRRLNFTGVVNNRRNSNNNRNASNESNNNTRNVATWYNENMYPGKRSNIPKSKRRFLRVNVGNSPTRRVKTVYHRNALARIIAHNPRNSRSPHTRRPFTVKNVRKFPQNKNRSGLRGNQRKQSNKRR